MFVFFNEIYEEMLLEGILSGRCVCVCGGGGGGGFFLEPITVGSFLILQDV